MRGYQWKSLFLPESTELRMTCAGQTFYARVEGDEIVYQGRPVSPRQLTLAIAGDGRNAWRDLWIRFPGETKWKTAACLRRALEKASAVAPVSPVEGITAAVAGLTEALKTALTFAGHASAQELALEKAVEEGREQASQVNRRHGQSRRADDILGETCAFD
ncbi:hypothetical protein C7C56_005815 [Massilia glaciei]|uniref:Uncharacterized protein n=1 Tax=Massilia glaciei TaxID=1524097 RepID=A0A2U2I4R6_9BURK|nr:hypothetical protein C7C56_005815 [Massilia glaciei]